MIENEETNITDDFSQAIDEIAGLTLEYAIKSLTDDRVKETLEAFNDDFINGYYLAVECLCGMRDSTIDATKEITKLGDSGLRDWDDRAATKLATYEEAEEAGTLTVLPCPIGTPIYWITKACQMPDDYECHRYYDCPDCDKCLPEIFETHFRYNMLNNSGKLKTGYYVNMADAKARLEEMKEENASQK